LKKELASLNDKKTVCSGDTYYPDVDCAQKMMFACAEEYLLSSEYRERLNTFVRDVDLTGKTGQKRTDYIEDQIIEFSDALPESLKGYVVYNPACVPAEIAGSVVYCINKPRLYDFSGDSIEDLFQKQLGFYRQDIVYDKAFKAYFGKSEKDITSQHMIYRPPNGSHKWEYNVDWLCKHLQKGSCFVVKSDLTEKAIYDRRREFGSGFFREVAICYALGYRFSYEEGNMVLRHPGREINCLENNLMHLSTGDKLVELEGPYREAMTDYNEVKKSAEHPRPPSHH
jgi:hypothetical protein